MSKVYSIISDIHGEYLKLIEILKLVDLNNEYLIINGDMTDRGKNSYKVVKHIMKLQKKYPKKVIVLKGNHEEFLIDWSKNGYDYYFKYLTPTIISFYKDGTNEELEGNLPLHKHFSKLFKKELNWLDNLPYKYEDKHMIVTHAGVDMLKGLENNTNDDFIGIRYWWDVPNNTGKLIVFGHTPLKNIHGKHDVYYDKENKYLGIDGFASGGGQLNLVKVSKGKLISTHKS